MVESWTKKFLDPSKLVEFNKCREGTSENPFVVISSGFSSSKRQIKTMVVVCKNYLKRLKDKHLEPFPAYATSNSNNKQHIGVEEQEEEKQLRQVVRDVGNTQKNPHKLSFADFVLSFPGSYLYSEVSVPPRITDIYIYIYITCDIKN